MFTQFQTECVSGFGLYMKGKKIKSAMNSIITSDGSGEQKTHCQIKIERGNGKYKLTQN